MPRLPRQLEPLARMLTYMLCHRPDEFGLVLSNEGFAPLNQVHQALVAEPGWGFVRRRHLEEVVALSLPPRFEVVAEQISGLSPGPARLRRPPGELPPALLYLAIPPKAHERVWEEGLKPSPGQELALARRPDLALKLGRRRAPEPVLVTIQARVAAVAGINFQGYGEELFLAPALRREFLQLPTPLQGKERSRPEPAPRPRPIPGGLILDLPQILQGPSKFQSKVKREPAWKSGTRALRRKRRGGGPGG
ncbi:MAG: RNA 2'-phosphotransferase [Desulfobaccales bacterium]|nr:RNA 2'-phosphotransferase [Desulfobaccales bacterium]